MTSKGNRAGDGIGLGWVEACHVLGEAVMGHLEEESSGCLRSWPCSAQSSTACSISVPLVYEEATTWNLSCEMTAKISLKHCSEVKRCAEGSSTLQVADATSKRSNTNTSRTWVSIMHERALGCWIPGSTAHSSGQGVWIRILIRQTQTPMQSMYKQTFTYGGQQTNIDI